MKIKRRDFLGSVVGSITLASFPGIRTGYAQGNIESADTRGNIFKGVTITKVESAKITGKRPRVVGRNSHLGVHGQIVKESIVRLTTNTGISGWGHSRAKEDDASKILGKNLCDLFDPENGTSEEFLKFDFSLWDLAGKLTGKSVHSMLGDKGCKEVPVYDGSIYFDDLDLETGADRGIQPILDNVEWAVNKGFRAFKLKVGRGFKWMEKKEGLKRDLDVIFAVRDLIGPDVKLFIDSNIGYTLAEMKEVISRTADANLFLVEEPFPEAREDFVAFKRFLRRNGYGTLIALGENAPGHEARFLNFIKSGLVDVVQWDMRGYTLSRWLKFMPVIEESGTITAPHNWYSHLGGFYIAQFGRGCPYFGIGEIDSVEMPGVISTGYQLADGFMTVPDSPGFGLRLDENIFSSALHEKDAWTVTL